MSKKILIIGDLIIDETWYVNANKLSPEAPIPVAFLTSQLPHLSPGGAGLAASYAKKNNIDSVFYTAAHADNFVWLAAKGINIHNAQRINNVTKTRYVDVNSNYHLLRVDNDHTVSFPTIDISKFSKKIYKILSDDIGGIAILDYNKGMFADTDICQFIIETAYQYNIPTYVDTRSNPTKFAGCNFLKLNAKEYDVACTDLGIDSPYALCSVLDISKLLITKGKEGATIYFPDTEIETDCGIDLTGYTGAPDVTGCGDVFDINFCYYCFIEGLIPTKALKLSTKKATEYAYMQIGDRLC